MYIPKFIHFIWVQGKPPLHYQENINGWRRLNPDYTVMVWSENTFMRNGLYGRLPAHMQRLYSTRQNYAYKSDIMRSQILKEMGGIYLDTDITPLKPLAEVIGNEINHNMFSMFITRSTIINSVRVPDIYMIAIRPNHPIWDKVHNALKINLVDHTGIHMVKYAIMYTNDFNDQNKIYVNDHLITRDKVYEDTAGIHKFDGSWVENMQVNGFIRESPDMDIILILILVFIAIITIGCIIAYKHHKSSSSVNNDKTRLPSELGST